MKFWKTLFFGRQLTDGKARAFPSKGQWGVQEMRHPGSTHPFAFMAGPVEFENGVVLALSVNRSFGAGITVGHGALVPDAPLAFHVDSLVDEDVKDAAWDGHIVYAPVTLDFVNALKGGGTLFIEQCGITIRLATTAGLGKAIDSLVSCARETRDALEEEDAREAREINI